MAVSNSAVAQQIIIEAQQGDTFYRVLKFWTDAARTVPLDLTGNTILINLYNSVNALILNFQPVVLGPGTIQWSKDKEYMGIREGIYRSDIKMLYADGTLLTLAGGPFVIVVKVI